MCTYLLCVCHALGSVLNVRVSWMFDCAMEHSDFYVVCVLCVNVDFNMNFFGKDERNCICARVVFLRINVYLSLTRAIFLLRIWFLF